jgi:FG-GAP-like repeat/Abnormal spindle-like microcephaly-assoc'd, ASPM-SPD-2-Hydin
MFRTLTRAIALLACAVAGAEAQLQTPHIQAINPPSLPPNDMVTAEIIGYGFNNGPTVRFNGQAQTTTLITDRLVEVTFATPSTPSSWLVTVTNDAGGVSNAVPYSSAPATATIGLAIPFQEIYEPEGLAVADFNGDGRADIATIQPPTTNASLGVTYPAALRILYNNGDGTFSPQTYSYITGYYYNQPVPLLAADLNGDGRPDVVFAQNTEPANCNPQCVQPSLIIFLNNGSGFSSPSYLFLQAAATAMAAGNFTNSGLVDLAVAIGNQVFIYQNTGNGYFQMQSSFDIGSPVLGLVAADFNSDGVSDVMAITSTAEVVGIYIGGPQRYSFGSIANTDGPSQIVLGDFNNDGFVDAAVLGASSVTILQSGGNGGFSSYSVGVPSGTTAIESGDFNDDGKVDLAVFGLAPYFLINNGGGFSLLTPHPPDSYYQSAFLAAGPFFSDGRLGLAALDNLTGLEVYSQSAAVSFSPAALTVSAQSPQTSPPQTVVVNNVGSDPLVFSAAPYIRSEDMGTFSIVSNNCPAALIAGSSCQLQLTYTAIPNFSPNISQIVFPDNATGQSLGFQIYQLTGNNLVPLAAMSGKLSFPNTIIGATSADKIETLSNFGTEPLTITSIAIQPGANAGANDFKISQNFCGAQVAANSSCQIHVSFTPSSELSESATLTVTDNDSNISGSTQSIGLTGTGVAPTVPDLTLSATSLGFGNVQVGHTSGAGAVTLTNIGAQSVAFSSIALTGINPGDFALVAGTNACTYGAFSLAPGASCTVSVTFTPTANGARSATVTLTDNNMGVANATQTIALSGSGEYGAPLIDIASPASTLLSNASGGFTLNLEGANLSAASVIDLNGTALATSVSGGALKGVVPAGLITAAGTESITVTNPGDPTSNVLFLPVGTAVIGAPEYTNASGSPFSAGSVEQLTVADFNGDGKPDLVGTAPGVAIVWISQGNGTFAEGAAFTSGAVYLPGSSYPTIIAPFSTVAGDFNGDGKTDVAVICQPFGVIIFLGNGQGGFNPQAYDPQTNLPLGMITGGQPQYGATGDFNNDGILDLAIANQDSTVSILLGQGGGAFSPSYSVNPNQGALWGIAAGDFNGDGIVDLVVSGFGANTVTALLGNGQGGFTPQTPVMTGASPLGLTIGDFNADGKLDVAVADAGSNAVSILLGNGDGTFTAGSPVTVGTTPYAVAAGDLNGDGKLDLVVANNGTNNASVLLGNGSGTFTANGSAVPTGNGPAWVAIADWNNDGKLDWATANSGSGSISILLSATGVATPSSNALGFGSQKAGVASKAQNVVLVNTGNGPLIVTAIAIGGANAADFPQTNTCGTLPAAIAGGSSCVVTVAFNPSKAGAESATLAFTDNSNGTLGSTQTVSLSGTGVVSFAVGPASVAFYYQGYKFPSLKQYVGIYNSSAIAVPISSLTITGADAGDFSETNTCGSSLAAGAYCVVTLGFTPSATGVRSATLMIADGATGSPQSVTLSGDGTYAPVAKLSKSSLTFPATSVGKTSAAQDIIVINYGDTNLTISSIVASGNFAQQNNCTAALAPGKYCGIAVTFRPTATGTRTGAITITDNGISTTQTVTLTGTGE